MQLMSKFISRESFENIVNWYNEAKENVLEETIFVLVATKTDLEQDRKISYDDGIALLNKYKFDLFFETSAKSGNGVVKMFEEASKEIMQHKMHIKNLNDELKDKHTTLSLHKDSKRGCC